MYAPPGENSMSARPPGTARSWRRRPSATEKTAPPAGPAVATTSPRGEKTTSTTGPRCVAVHPGLLPFAGQTAIVPALSPAATSLPFAETATAVAPAEPCRVGSAVPSPAHSYVDPLDAPAAITAASREIP